LEVGDRGESSTATKKERERVREGEGAGGRDRAASPARAFQPRACACVRACVRACVLRACARNITGRVSALFLSYAGAKERYAALARAEFFLARFHLGNARFLHDLCTVISPEMSQLFLLFFWHRFMTLSFSFLFYPLPGSLLFNFPYVKFISVTLAFRRTNFALEMNSCDSRSH
jgi:hypothetical protein